ncbi:hypothetical protein PHMEG_00014454 [Phytophthora megakarya]|uniref:Uncharacterized protein n=1 Tax=Phytophthora megakarya TaxID=4795 RepID=A0A225W5C4_9STRA|nr:hypothetical protein PHMEG_00014454 [Phytophthora megakarya]
MKCAGIGPDHKYESSGFLTADFTQKTCTSVSGFIVENTFGNQKCCSVPDFNKEIFTRSCTGQKPRPNFPNYRGNVVAC